jgi:hypothetical protein
MDDVKFEQQVERLNEASKSESEEIKHIVAEVVETYHPND